jgi:hypothetical protein
MGSLLEPVKMKRRHPDLSHWTDEQLQKGWEAGFESRVKSGRYKGCITVRAARLGDAIIAEAGRRGFRLTTPAKYE